jgi:hypothetical protein
MTLFKTYESCKVLYRPSGGTLCYITSPEGRTLTAFRLAFIRVTYTTEVGPLGR